MPKHKHADLIKAWADGAKIECRGEVGEPWLPTTHPAWYEDYYYRIKPEDIELVQYYQSSARKDLVWNLTSKDMDNQRVKWIIDGETGRIKSVELLDK